MVSNPSHDKETALRGIWEIVLGVDVEPQSDFFELGGHSLTAAEVTASARGKFDAPVPLRLLFDHPVFADYTEAVHHFLGAMVKPAPQ